MTTFNLIDASAHRAPPLQRRRYSQVVTNLSHELLLDLAVSRDRASGSCFGISIDGGFAAFSRKEASGVT